MTDTHTTETAGFTSASRTRCAINCFRGFNARFPGCMQHDGCRSAHVSISISHYLGLKTAVVQTNQRPRRKHGRGGDRNEGRLPCYERSKDVDEIPADDIQKLHCNHPISVHSTENSRLRRWSWGKTGGEGE
jgi:hypothetical protein